MAVSVLLDDIIEGMEAQSDAIKPFLNKITGKVVFISDEELRFTEESVDPDSLPEWQKETMETAKEILETDHYIQLPDRFEINEYGMMEKFCLSLKDRELREIMYRSIKGSGAFQRFKKNIHRFDLADEWYDYRNNLMKELAREWCEDNAVDCVDSE